MAIDHPQWLLSTLCSISGVVDRRTLYEKLIEISGSKIAASSKSLQMCIFVSLNSRAVIANAARLENQVRVFLPLMARKPVAMMKMAAMAATA